MAVILGLNFGFPCTCKQTLGFSGKKSNVHQNNLEGYGDSCIVRIACGKGFAVNLLVFRLNWTISLRVCMAAVGIAATELSTTIHWLFQASGGSGCY